MAKKLTHNQRNIIHLQNKDFNGLLKTNFRYIEKLSYTFGISDIEVIKDLQQAGSIGLFKAFLNYKMPGADGEKYPGENVGEIPGGGVVFIGYASYYIKKEMIDFLNKHLRTIKIPTQQLNPNHKGHNPNLPTNVPTISTNTPLNDENSSTVEDLLTDDCDIKEFDDKETRLLNDLNDKISQLKELHQKIILMRIIEEKSFREIADELNVTHQRISQIYTATIKKLQLKFGVEPTKQRAKHIFNENSRKK